VRESRVSSITNLDRPAANLQSPAVAKLSVILEEGPQKPPATLGDVLYAKAKRAVPEQHWATLVEAVAAGNQLALHELYELAHRIVFTLIMRLTANRETAEELTSTFSTTSGGVRGVTTPRTARCSAGS
jgi:hypothetical protein